MFLNKQDFVTSYYFLSNKHAYIDAVRAGDLEIIQRYFGSHYALNSKGYMIPWDDEVFTCICTYGHLHILEWMLSVQHEDPAGFGRVLRFTQHNFLQAVKSDNAAFVMRLEQLYLLSGAFEKEKLDGIALVTALINTVDPKNNELVQYLLTKPELYLTPLTKNELNKSYVSARVSPQGLRFMLDTLQVPPTLEQMSSVLKSSSQKEFEPVNAEVQKLQLLWELMSRTETPETLLMKQQEWLFYVATEGCVEVAEFVFSTLIDKSDTKNFIFDLLRSFEHRMFHSSPIDLVEHGVLILELVVMDFLEYKSFIEMKLRKLVAKHKVIKPYIETRLLDKNHCDLRILLGLNMNTKTQQLDDSNLISYRCWQQLNSSITELASFAQDVLGPHVIADINRHYLACYL
jgi:hypothetical protein